MSDKVYPLYDFHRRGFSTTCAEHDWQNSDCGAYADRAVKWWDFGCKKCYGLVRVDVNDWPMRSAQIPPFPPVNHNELMKLVEERPHSRAFDE